MSAYPTVQFDSKFPTQLSQTLDTFREVFTQCEAVLQQIAVECCLTPTPLPKSKA